MKMSQSSTERLERHTGKDLHLFKALLLMLVMFITIMLVGGILSGANTGNMPFQQMISTEIPIEKPDIIDYPPTEIPKP